MSTSPEQTSRPRVNRWLLLAVVALAVLTVVAIVFAVVQTASSGSGTPVTNPTSSSTPTPTPTATSTPTPQPPAPPSDGGPTQPSPASAQILSFSVSPTTVTCSTGGPAVPGVSSAPLTITWETKGASNVFVGVDTGDAQAAPYQGGLPASGSITSLQYSCPDDHRYTITIVGADGSKQSRTITVTNIGDK